MDYQQFVAVVIVLLMMSVGLLLLVIMEVRAHYKQREEMTKLLILSLLRMSNRHVKAVEDQTKRVDALLEQLRAGTQRIDPAVVERGADADADRDEEAEREAAAVGEAMSAEAARQRQRERP
jgi:hypothetical protein